MKGEARFREMVEHIRAKPGLYLGARGPDLLPRAVQNILQDLMERIPAGYAGPLTLSLDQTGAITLTLPDTHLDIFIPSAADLWVDSMLEKGWPMLFGFCACERFEIIAGDGNRIAKLCFTETHDLEISESVGSGQTFLRFVLKPFRNDFAGLKPDHLYSMAGILKDMSLLRAGLATTFRAHQFNSELKYYYRDGLRSFLCEDDYARFPLGNGLVTFNGEAGGSKLEGCLRFLHAGSPRVRSYVNHLPTQGGAHLEGLGKALADVFPDAHLGCRPLTFVTNSNTGAHVSTPHSFIGAIHLQTEHPRFDGPTKDILVGEDVRDFVYSVALPKLREWK